MNFKTLTLSFASLLMVATTTAQTPLWQGKGRIAISSDGNEHDHDDWAATPMSLALLAARELQDKLALYTFSDHVWGSNQEMPLVQGMTAYEHMRESALGGAKHFGYDSTRFICAVDNAEIAYNAMRDQINMSSEDNPLIIIAAGPMQVVGEAMNRSRVECRKYVTVVSHSGWNNAHSDSPYMKTDWDRHHGWTFNDMKDAFSSEKGGEATFIKILDQNKGKDYIGLFTNMKHYDWVKESSARNNPAYQAGSWDWLYGRLGSCVKRGDNFDPSDAGMIIYLLTGVDKTNPDMAREIMENPTTEDGKEIK
ncbi:MAG: hypothetical protein SNG10_03640 [Rikenellaceae bacterium]